MGSMSDPRLSLVAQFDELVRNGSVLNTGLETGNFKLAEYYYQKIILLAILKLCDKLKTESAFYWAFVQLYFDSFRILEVCAVPRVMSQEMAVV